MNRIAPPPKGPLGHALSWLDRRARVIHRLALFAATMIVPLATLGVLFWSQIEADVRIAEAERRGLGAAAKVWSELVRTSRQAPCAADTNGPDRGRCADPAGVEAQRQHLIDLALSSQLLLDPDLASYRAIELALVRLPAVIAADVQVQTKAAHAAPTSEVWQARGRLDAAINDALTSADAIKHQALLKRDVDALTARARVYLDTMPTQADDEERRLFLKALDDVWASSVSFTDAALEQRIARLRGQLLTGFGLSVVALALAIVLMGLAARAITRPQRRLAQSIDALVADDADVNIPYLDHQTEVGALARKLDALRAKLHDRTAFAADQFAARQRQEETIRTRTIAFEEAAAKAESTARTLAMALTTAKAGAWGFDPSTGEFWSSPEVDSIFGEPLRRSDFENGLDRFMAPEDRSSLRKAWREFFETGYGQGDVRIRRFDGDVRWVHATLERLDDGLVLGLAMDVTERKTQELRLAAATQAAEAANRAKSEFLAMMSHEIRTPLNGMLGMCAALEGTDLAPAQREMVRVLNDSGGVLLTVLNDVLDLSKIEAGHMQLEDVVFDVAGAVETVAALYRAAAEKKGLRLDVERAPDLASHVRGDPVRVRQIVQNLLSNAVKFTDAGSVQVRVSSKPDGAERVRLRIEVEDTGRGMTAEQASRVFERFAQAETSTTRQFGGTGLGLSICRSLARLMGGEVGVASAPDVGSTFWFEAPLTCASATASERIDAGANGAGMRILAADDNETNRLVLTTLLTQAGITADIATNGVAAIEAARTTRYDVILMDVHMPHMDGLQAARAIRASGGPNADTPIIALSADAMRAHAEGSLAAGLTAYVAKPIDPAKLFAAIAKALEPSEDGGKVGRDAA